MKELVTQLKQNLTFVLISGSIIVAIALVA